MSNTPIAEKIAPLRAELEHFPKRHRCRPKPAEVDELVARVDRLLTRRERRPASAAPRISALTLARS